MDVCRYGKCPTYNVDRNAYIREILGALILEAEDRTCSAALPVATFEDGHAESGPIDGDAIRMGGDMRGQRCVESWRRRRSRAPRPVAISRMVA